MDTASGHTIALSLLGTFRVTLDGAPVAGFRSDKARGLLAYLAVEADQPHARDKLAGLLWPDWPNREARTYLRQALSNLREILADRDKVNPLLVGDRQTIRFADCDRVRVDVRNFEAGTARVQAGQGQALTPDTPSALQEAIALYDGPFMDGFSLPDCAAFEEWLLITSERLSQRMLAALAALASHHEANGDADGALMYARRCLEIDPLREESHRHLMRLLAQAGQRTAALVQFETCRRLLADELAVDPSEETLALHRQIQRGELIIQAPHQLGAAKMKTSGDDSPHHHLPAPTTSFVGRSREVAELVTLVRRENSRLITLTGPGGVGKTRLALELGHALRDSFAGGVHFVPLAPLSDPDHLISAIADVMDVRESASLTLERSLHAALRDSRCLLILDNFEHILPAAPTVSTLLAHAPQLAVLATSRTLLHLYGEIEIQVAPLAVRADGDGDQDAAATYPGAIDLFVQRARAVQAGFELDQRTAPAVSAICSMLDGLPLAIELAAARVKRFPPSFLLERLTQQASASLDLLRDGPRDVVGRHRSLRDTIGWSYELLDADHQAIFRPLSVFAGSFSAEAAHAVCRPLARRSLPVSDMLWALAENSLLRHVGYDGDTPRYLLLDTVRQFGLECLMAHDELTRARRAHAEYYLALSEETEPSVDYMHSAAVLSRLERETDNLRSALVFAAESPSDELRLRLNGALWDFWYQRGSISEGYGWLVKALTLSEARRPTREYALALYGAGHLAMLLGDLRTAIRYMARSLRISEAVDDAAMAALIIQRLGGVCYSKGNYRAWRNLFEKALEMRRKLGNPYGVAMTLGEEGIGAARLGDLPKARRSLEEALALLQPLEEGVGLAMVFEWQGTLCRLEGNLRVARTYLEESRRSSKDSLHLTYACATRELAALADDEVQIDEACSLLAESLTTFDRLGERDDAIHCLEEIVVWYALCRRNAQAVRLASAIAKLRGETRTISPPAYQARFDRSLASARAVLSQAEADAAWAAGQLMTFEEMVAFAKDELAS